jgi:hypothetical protein
MAKKIHIPPLVVHSASLTVEERASALGDVSPPSGWSKMQVQNPAEWSEGWVGFGNRQRALFRTDDGGATYYCIVPNSEVNTFSRAGLFLIS